MVELSEELMDKHEIKAFLEEKVDQYNRPEFMDTDPISVPHQFSKKEDIEISAFLTATIAWGQRRIIIQSASKMMKLMGHAPFEFVMQAGDRAREVCRSFVHRTFQGPDCVFFIESLRNLYQKYGGLEAAFTSGYQKEGDIRSALILFRELFLEPMHLKRTEKHIADIQSGSSAKRLNMFLRWMVRLDQSGVDFGLWENIDPAALYMPLDVHTASVARKLGLLHRKSNDWKAVEELTGVMRLYDPLDPVKFDYALFGPGIFERF